MLELKSIAAEYGHVRALKGVSLAIQKGEIVTLLGANGAGKTTALKCISGLLRLTSGTITFQGERIDQLPPHRIIRRGIIQVMEGRRLFPDLDVLENLRLGAYLINDRRAIQEKMDRIFGYFPILKARQHQLASTFSGGEQQMLAIGRGLMASPQLLMLDEPSLGLAPDHGPGGRQDHPDHQRGRGDPAAHRAECQDGPAAGQPGLCARDRHRGHRRNLPGTHLQRQGPEGLHGVVRFSSEESPGPSPPAGFMNARPKSNLECIVSDCENGHSGEGS